MAPQVQLDFYGVEVWLPILVAVVSIFLAWLCVRVLNSYDDQQQSEDEKLNEIIKTNLNPDKVKIQQNTIVEEEDISDNDEEDISDNDELNVEKKMSESEKQNERRIEQEQLQEIFKMMEENKDKYGVKSVGDVKEQLKRYK